MRYADQYCTYQPQSKDGKHVYIFTGECLITHKKYSVTIPGEELHDYRKGHLIQIAMPSVSKEDREFLMSGISPEGWEVEFELPEGSQE